MGVRDLQAWLETDPSMVGARATVDLVRAAWAREGKVGLERPGRLALVLDAESCLDRLYGGFYSDWTCGGQWNHMLEFLSVLFSSLQQANIHVATFLDGSLEPGRREEWIAEQLKARQHVKQVLRHVTKRGTPPPKVWWVPPTGLRSVLRLCLRYLAVPVMSSVEQHGLEVVQFLRENGFHGLLGDNSEYCIFDPPKYYSAKKLKLTLKFTVETQQLDMDEVAKLFDLNPNRFSLTAALLGGRQLTELDLQEFHARLIPGKGAPHKTDPSILIKAVVNYIRTLVNIDDLDSLGAEIFGSPTDERVAKLKRVVAHYTSGTADGYKAARLVKRKGKEEAVSDAVTGLASDTKEADTESKDWYEMVTQGRKASALVNSETEEATDQLSGLALAEDTAEVKPAKVDAVKDSEEAVAAVASNTAQPSKEGKYPLHKEPDQAQVPVVSAEVVRTATERHRQGQMSPLLLQLLTQGQLLLPVLLEEQGDTDPQARIGGGVHLVYRTLRRRIYGILFNEHHRVYTQGRQEEELAMAKLKVKDLAKKLTTVNESSIIIKNKEPRSEKEVVRERLEAAAAVVDQLARVMEPVQEETVVQEWLPYSRYTQADPVPPLALDWPVPTVQRLWFGAGQEDKQRRLRAFLSVLGADSPLMLETSHVPQHLLLMAAVLRYIMRQTSVLRKPELDSFLITAFSPELLDADYLAHAKLDLVTPRGLQLSTLFMQGVEMALLANDACGAPVPFLMCCPWLFFDGKLFHSKLRRAVSATNLLEMCEHRMDLVVKVERMRRAILEGLLPEFSAYSQQPPGMMAPHPTGPWGHPGRPHGFQQALALASRPPSLVARGGQLVVAGSVVGQWGANWGPGGQGRLVAQRTRGNRGGKKVQEKKDDVMKGKEEQIKILRKEKPGKEFNDEDVVVEG